MANEAGLIELELSPQEWVVAEWASFGYTTKYIANKLNRSARTIECQIISIYRKLGISNRDELIDTLCSH